MEVVTRNSFSQSVKKTPLNRFIIKSFSRITHLMIKKYWAHNHNFKEIGKLIAHCGGKEVQRHLLKAQKNGNYMPLQYIHNTSVEQMAIYATLDHKRKISEHFVAIIPISKMVGMQFSTTNVLSVFGSYFQKLEITFKNNARFFLMDTKIVNSSERSSLKQVLKHLISLASWTGCENHKVILCFSAFTA